MPKGEEMTEETKNLIKNCILASVVFLILILLIVLILNIFGDKAFGYCCTNVGGEIFYENGIKHCSINGTDYCRFDNSNFIEILKWREE